MGHEVGMMRRWWTAAAAIGLGSALLLSGCRPPDPEQELGSCVDKAMAGVRLDNLKERDVRRKLLKLQARAQCEEELQR